MLKFWFYLDWIRTFRLSIQINNPLLKLDCQSKSTSTKWIIIPIGQSTNTIQQYTRGWFHQTLCAKRKDASAQCPAKNLPINFINISKCQICRLKFAKFVRRLPNAIRHKRRRILWANFLPKAVRRQIFASWKCWWNRP